MFRILSRSARNAASKEQALRKVRPMEEKKPGRHNLLQDKPVCSGPGEENQEKSSFSYLFRMIFFVICLYAILTKVNETLRKVAKIISSQTHFHSIRNPKFTLHN